MTRRRSSRSSAPKAHRGKPDRAREAEKLMARFQQLSKEISTERPKGLSAVEAVRFERGHDRRYL